jgi:hypothetical protein
MNGLALLETGLLLGLYVLLGGGWGLLYTVARLRCTPALRIAGVATYGLQVAAAAAIVLATPLAPGWKGLIVASTTAFRAVPPLVWRFLQHTHDNRGSEDGRQPPKHPGRAVARL